MGQQVIVDNRGGAASSIGPRLPAKATPDGYTMMLGTSGGLVSLPVIGVAVHSGFNASAWFCLVFAAGAFKAVAARFIAQPNRIITSTEFGNPILLQGAEPASRTPQQPREKIHSESDHGLVTRRTPDRLRRP